MIKGLFTIFLMLVTSVFSQHLFTSKDYGFEISFPGYMTISRETDSRAAVLAYVNTYTSLNIVAAAETSSVTIEDYDLAAFTDELKRGLASDMAGFGFIESGRKDINGNGSIYIDYNYLKGNEKMRAVQYFLKHNSRMYAITTVSPDSEYKENEIVFKACLDTFKFIE